MIIFIVFLKVGVWVLIPPACNFSLPLSKTLFRTLSLQLSVFDRIFNFFVLFVNRSESKCKTISPSTVLMIPSHLTIDLISDCFSQKNINSSYTSYSTSPQSFTWKRRMNCDLESSTVLILHLYVFALVRNQGSSDWGRTFVRLAVRIE